MKEKNIFPIREVVGKLLPQRILNQKTVLKENVVINNSKEIKIKDTISQNKNNQDEFLKLVAEKKKNTKPNLKFYLRSKL